MVFIFKEVAWRDKWEALLFSMDGPEFISLWAYTHVSTKEEGLFDQLTEDKWTKALVAGAQQEAPHWLTFYGYH